MEIRHTSLESGEALRRVLDPIRPDFDVRFSTVLRQVEAGFSVLALLPEEESPEAVYSMPYSPVFLGRQLVGEPPALRRLYALPFKRSSLSGPAYGSQYSFQFITPPDGVDPVSAWVEPNYPCAKQGEIVCDTGRLPTEALLREIGEFGVCLQRMADLNDQAAGEGLA